MKPIIIYLDKQDKISLTKEEFERYIREAYDQGYNCGYADGKRNYWTPYWYGNTLTTTNSSITIDPYTPIKTAPNITWTCTPTSVATISPTTSSSGANVTITGSPKGYARAWAHENGCCRR